MKPKKRKIKAKENKMKPKSIIHNSDTMCIVCHWVL